MAQVFCVVNVGRQVDGDGILVMFEKAFSASHKAELFVKDKAQQYVQYYPGQDGTQVQFVIERRIHTLELE